MPAVKRKIICYIFITNSHYVINAAYTSQIHIEILSILTSKRQFVHLRLMFCIYIHFCRKLRHALMNVDCEQLISVVTHDTVYCRINEPIHRTLIFLKIRKPWVLEWSDAFIILSGHSLSLLENTEILTCKCGSGIIFKSTWLIMWKWGFMTGKFGLYSKLFKISPKVTINRKLRECLENCNLILNGPLKEWWVQTIHNFVICLSFLLSSYLVSECLPTNNCGCGCRLFTGLFSCAPQTESTGAVSLHWQCATLF